MSDAAGIKVVLVHGFLDTGWVFRRMKLRLERQGAVCLVPRLRPNDGRGGLVALAENLKRDIDTAFGPSAKIRIVAFSMGGLVSRHYLQVLGGAGRCEKLFTISSPHHGTATARMYPSKGARDMRPGSIFLRRLHATEETLREVQLVSYHTPMDLMILPATSSVWPRALNLDFPVLLHPLMLSDEDVLSDVERRVMR
ncbi:MAG: lipase [Verrucomicrobia bacterium]|nr:lipase [Verrucomicrobiota bacterium]